MNLAEPAVVETRAGKARTVKPTLVVADVKVFYKPKHGHPTYVVTVTTHLPLPDGTSITQKVHFTVNIVPRPAGHQEIQWGELKQLSGAKRDAHRATYELSRLVAYVVAQTSLLRFDEEPPGGTGGAHDPEVPADPSVHRG